MKILFVLGFPSLFAGAAWTRIGFFAENWSKKGHAASVLGAFTYSRLKKGAAGNLIRCASLILSLT